MNKIADMSDAVWLIERGQAAGQSPTIWWVGGEFKSGQPYGGQWTETANQAMQFETKRGANEIAEREISNFYSITEHMFLDK